MKMHWLIDRCAHYASQQAIIFNDLSYDYQSLQTHALQALARIKQANLPKGCVVSIEGDFTPYTCAVMLALIQQQHMIVPIGDVPDGKRTQYLKVAQVAYRIQFNQEHYALNATEITHPNNRHPHYQTLTDHGDVRNVRGLENDVFHFRGINLFTANIDDL